VVLLQGARTPEELLYGDEFRAFAERASAVPFRPVLLARVAGCRLAARHADVRHGYVQAALAEFAPDAGGDIAYLCGNPNMVDACFEALKEHGLPIPQIRREKYVSNK
jgi:NAD(P)H-flavin reductase